MLTTSQIQRAIILTSSLLLLLSSTTINIAAAEPGSGSVTPESFSAAGLNNEAALMGTFLGESNEIDISREDMLFSTLFQQYLESYSRSCGAHLPANKVEMTRRRCVREQVTRNGFGVEISRTCVSYVDEGTGLYAKPKMLAAQQEIDRLMAAESLRNVWRIISMSQSDPFAGAMDLANRAQAAASDMSALVRKNACSGPGLMRFEENLRRFAWNEQLIRLERDNSPAQGSKLPSRAILRNLDYSDLITDLVADQARGWVLNRFVGGSVREVAVSSQDAEGMPSRISAAYTFDGLNGRSRGSVSVHLADGLPSCMYFSDASNVCRTPNRQIMARYTKEAQIGAPAPSEPESPAAEVAAAPPFSAIDTTSFAAPAPTPVTAKARRNAPVVAPLQAEPRPDTAKPTPKRELKAVSYIQGIKDACLEVLSGGERREPMASYCFCLSAASGAASISESDAQWFFESFSAEAAEEIERKYPPLVRMFASCRAQLEARSNPS